MCELVRRGQEIDFSVGKRQSLHSASYRGCSLHGMRHYLVGVILAIENKSPQRLAHSVLRGRYVLYNAG